MKIKKITIKTKEEFFSDIASAIKAVNSRKTTKPRRGEYFELEAVRNVLTEKRLEIWRAIRNQKPDSILALAKLLHRDFKSVYRDVSMLVAVGLVELRKGKGARGDTQKPISMADSLRLEVA
ncbi:MAG TPA: hypothetical protein DCS07_00965 [Bdellovibrionales bacterium]|nr:MAG: hypothetical protein A2Z97_10830 [Bdellovibrionales bacterium GWB1_52_6]OFZ03546.1 MAG: hypothetical protein A2X97_06260 [Bdellovibrionales bacterium GWA1_52_35]OFZ38325.1 MAG: hypothetical protein A2070_14985 [Bdellovibrionales bacterium GWC1_52_8]HAR41198.1 hypothetical protein [Bdellovibrionales bacterium]HCM41132.1 hypothetical protein [Bdellovibrionales bacterium]